MAFTTKSSRKQEDLLGSLTAIQSLPDLNQFTYEFQNTVWRTQDNPETQGLFSH